jgi:acyl dehydratase
MTTLLQPGDTMSFRKTLTVAEQALYTGISGNLAPLYVDQRAARDVGFEGVLAFELHGLALATTALNRLAGPAWRLGGVQLDFTAPVFVGQTVVSTVEVTDVNAEAVTCRVICALASGATVAQGTARLVPAKAA